METNNYTILVVDDEPDICQIVRFNLEMEGYDVETALSAEEAQQMIKTAGESHYQLVILDVMMGGMSGFDLARILQRDKQTASIPIVFLTAKDAESDIVTGLNIGADDYISKPFGNRELTARIKAILRRHERHDSQTTAPRETLTYKTLELFGNEKRACIGGIDVALTRTEYNVLELLLQNPRKVFSRQELIDKAWPTDVMVSDRSVDVGINRIRKKIGDYATNICTRQGFGYCFVM